MVRRVFRSRVLVYLGILAVVTVALGVSLYLRIPLKLDVLRDRSSLAREVEDGRIENTYRLQIMNTQEAARRYRIGASGLPGITVASEPEVEVPAATTQQVPLRLQIAPGVAEKGSHRIEVEVRATDDPAIGAREKSVFLVR
jgi:polyferredoxin